MSSYDRTGPRVEMRRKDAGRRRAPTARAASLRSVGELVEGRYDAVEGVDLPRDPLRVKVTRGARDAKSEDDLAPTCHRALETDGAIAAASGETFARVEAKRVDGAPYLLAEVCVLTADDATESVDGADGLDDV